MSGSSELSVWGCRESWCGAGGSWGRAPRTPTPHPPRLRACDAGGILSSRGRGPCPPGPEAKVEKAPGSVQKGERARPRGIPASQSLSRNGSPQSPQVPPEGGPELGNSHGPDVDFGAVFLPGEKLGRGVGRAAALRAERVRVAQDARTVAQPEVCREGRTHQLRVTPPRT